MKVQTGLHVGQPDKRVYGADGLILSYSPPAISRLLGDTTVNIKDWFRGLVLSAVDSSTYNRTKDTNLPMPAAALTRSRPDIPATAPLTNLISSKIDEGSARPSMVRTFSLTFANPIDKIKCGGARSPTRTMCPSR